MKHTNICNYLNASNIINYKRILCFILNNPYGITSKNPQEAVKAACGFLYRMSQQCVDITIIMSTTQ